MIIYDKETFRTLVEKCGRFHKEIMVFANDEIKDDRELILFALSINADMMEYIPEKWKDDESFINEAIDRADAAKIIEHSGENIKKNKDIIKLALEKKPLTVRYIDDSLRLDSELATIATQKDPNLIIYFNDSIEGYKELVKKALENNPNILFNFGESIRNDKDIIKMLFNNNKSFNFSIIGENLKNDKDFINEVLESPLVNNYNMHYLISDELFEDTNFILSIYEKKPFDVGYEHVEASDNVKFVMELKEKTGNSIENMDSYVISNREELINLITNEYKAIAFKYASNELREDEEVARLAIKQRSYTFKYAGEKLRSSKEFILSVLPNSSGILKLLPEELRDDYDVARCAALNSYFSNAFPYISKRLRNDMNFVNEILNNREVDINAAETLMKCAGDDIKNNKDLVLNLFNRFYDGTILYGYVGDKLKEDREIAFLALKNFPTIDNYKYVPEKIRKSLEIANFAFQEKNFYLLKTVLDNDEYANRDVFEMLRQVYVENGLYKINTIKYTNTVDDEETIKKMIDSEVIDESTDYCANALKNASERLRNSKETILYGIQKDASSIKYASPELKKDKDVILSAIRKYKRIDWEIEEREYTTEHRNTPILLYFSDEARNDKDIVREVLVKDPEEIVYIGKNLINDDEFMNEILKEYPNIMNYLYNF